MKIVFGLFVVGILVYAFLTSHYNPLFLLLVGPGLVAISKGTKKK
ncbi:hypothetical protein ACKUSY_01670 [Myroides odoratus]